MSGQTWTWVGFILFVLSMLALDLGVFHRKSHEVTIREALAWSGVWIILALLFNLGVYYWLGPEPALAFLTGYLIEKSLSVDNIFVFLLILTYFRVPPRYQHQVLFWGILGALVMRAILIVLGISLIQRFHWVIYLFGAFLILTGVKMALEKDKEIHPERNPALRLFRRLAPVTDDYREGKFFVKQEGRYFATPLFIALLVVETTDLIFAVDSIPAILAITLDPFIIYTSNVFAILGLRSLYFVLEHFFSLFRFLHYGLAIVLMLVGLKMLTSHFYEPSLVVTLGVVVLILGASVAASLIWPEKAEESTS